jgi:hypothetical protein
LRLVEEIDYLGNPTKLSRWSMIVKESNPFFEWYKRAKAWKVVEEWEI